MGQDTPRLPRLTTIQRMALESVERHVGSARRILFVINLLCGFLFVLVFEMLFAWQTIRPGASTALCVDNLARLAAFDSLYVSVLRRDHTPALTPLEKAFAAFGRVHVNNTLGITDSNPPQLVINVPTGHPSGIPDDSVHVPIRNALQARLDTMPVWEKDAWVMELGAGLKTIDSLFRDSLLRQKEPGNIAGRGIFIPMDVIDISLLAIGVSPSFSPTLDVVSRYETIAVRHPIIRLAAQEILDRWQVNEETHSYRVSPRKRSLPIVGNTIQMEDIGIPIGIFLLFLAFWLQSSMRKAIESVVICRSYFPSSLREDFVHLMTDAFLFLRWNSPRSCDHADRGNQAESSSSVKSSRFPRPHAIHFSRPVVLLFLAPYLVITTTFIAGLYENLIMDFRYHAGYYAFRAATQRALVFEEVMLLAIAVLLALVAWRVVATFHELYWRFRELNVELPDNHLDAGESNKTLGASYNASRQSLRAAFWWTVFAPFAVLGTYFVLLVVSRMHVYDWFLTTSGTLVYLLAIGSFFYGGYEVVRRRTLGGKQAVPFWFAGAMFAPILLVIIYGIGMIAAGTLPDYTAVQDRYLLLFSLFWVLSLATAILASSFWAVRQRKGEAPAFRYDLVPNLRWDSPEVPEEHHYPRCASLV